MKSTSLILIISAAMLLLTMESSNATGLSAPEDDRRDKLGVVHSRIAGGDWSGAIAELHRVNDQDSADWNSLMGYCLQMQNAPDYDAARWYYGQALLIQPWNFKALGYSGEIFLLDHDLAKAEQRLQTLGNACELSCDEYRHLQLLIDRYKSASVR